MVSARQDKWRSHQRIFDLCMSYLYIFIVPFLETFILVMFATNSLVFPKNITKLAGIEKTTHDHVKIDNANAIKDQFVAGNTTPAETIALLDFLVENVYQSTPLLAISPDACEFNGLAKLECPSTPLRSPRTDGMPIRSVSLAGLFIPAPWATGGKELSIDQAASFYTSKDFEEMKDLGLNTVQLTVPTVAFLPSDKHGKKVMEVLNSIMTNVEMAGLQMILTLTATGDELDTVVSAADFVASHPVFLALTLPKGMTIDTTTVVGSIRVIAPDLPLFVPLTQADLVQLKSNGFASDPNVFGSLELSHTVTVADIGM